MRAARIVEPGKPPLVADLPVPVAGPGETLVEVGAAPVTPLDLLCATGTSYFGRPRTPYVPGVQGAASRTGGRCGSRPRPEWPRVTAAWRSSRRCRRTTSSNCPPGPTRSRWPRSGSRPSPRTWR
ncbi:hypothetical protein GCM10027612_60600 [Microbispora bryophytorum subsp. camponoti]